MFYLSAMNERTYKEYKARRNVQQIFIFTYKTNTKHINYCRRCHESYIFRTRIMSINLSIKFPNKLIRHFTKFLNFDWCSLACIAC